MMETVPIEDQAAEAVTFLEGLLERFGLSARVVTRSVDEETIELAVEGEDLGLLVGPRGQVLTSLQELTRTVVQRKTGAHNGRLLVDVAGYRHRRREALERFTRKVAEEVLQRGERTALEPMSPPDRKVVHDTVNTIDGLRTTSEGEEPHRRVVIIPEQLDA